MADDLAVNGLVLRRSLKLLNVSEKKAGDLTRY
jgi:hypothetical protein